MKANPSRIRSRGGEVGGGGGVHVTCKEENNISIKFQFVKLKRLLARPRHGRKLKSALNTFRPYGLNSSGLG
jgi:hypothetical protein